MIFGFDPERALAALDVFGRARDGRVVMTGGTFTQGIMGTLVHAELLAGAAGVGRPMRAGGELAVDSIGDAAERVAKAPEGVRVIYLASHAAVQRAHASARPFTPSGGASNPMGDLGDVGELPGLGALVGLGVVGIAASIATAWYARGPSSRVDVEGRNVRTASLLATVAEMARAQVEAGREVSPSLYAPLRELAGLEDPNGWVPAAVVGGVAAVAIIATAAVLAHRDAHAPREDRS